MFVYDILLVNQCFFKSMVRIVPRRRGVSEAGSRNSRRPIAAQLCSMTRARHAPRTSPRSDTILLSCLRRRCCLMRRLAKDAGIKATGQDGHHLIDGTGSVTITTYGSTNTCS